MLWKNVFHTMENPGLVFHAMEKLSAVFHPMEKKFPPCGKFLGQPAGLAQERLGPGHIGR